MMRFKYLSIVTFFVMIFSTCFAQSKVETNFVKNVDKAKMLQWVDSTFNTMSLDERIGQLITIHTVTDNTASNRANIVNLVKNYYAGGILLSKGTAQNQAILTNLAQKNAKTPLIVTFDGEWGLSMRLANTTQFPRNMMLGAIQEDSLIYLYGKEMARQCKLMGIQVNFAPDMDVNSNPANPVIGNRSFGEDPDRVAKLGIAYSRGIEDGGVMAVSKHFPGHGDTSTDSHKTLPLIKHDRNRLEKIEFIPFQRYIDAGLSGIMVAHLNIPALDNSGLPSSLSKPIVTDLLQDKFGFTGLIFTDGLAMQGVANEKDMSVKAVLAGNDILLGPTNALKEFKALRAAVADGTLSEDIINERCRKILAYKYILGLDMVNVIDEENILSQLNIPYAEWLNRKLNQKAITLLKDKEHLIPLKKLDKRSIAAVSIGASAGNSFQKTLKRYDNVTCFNVADASELSKIKTSLDKYNTIIVSIHQNKAYNQEIIQSVLKGKESILAFFTVPYRMSSYQAAIKDADAVIVGYENTVFAQEYTAQAIFGGNDIEGKLPVSVKGLYEVGDGITTEKSRLSYSIPEEVGMSSDKLDNIANIAMEGIENEAYPGCQILIAKDGVVIYDRAFGTFEYNKQREVTTEDLYDLASMTKATATIPALMKLYDEKKITLQSPLSKYIPQLKGTDKDKITIRQALFHETGIPAFIQYYMPAIDGNSYSGRLFSNQQTEIYSALLDNVMWARTDYKFKPNLVSSTSKPGFTKQIAEGLYISDSYNDTIVQRIADSKLRPNKKYLYSCLNFMLLKEVVEDASKENLNTFLQNNFYKKLGAYTTTFNPRKKFPKDEIVPTEQDDFLRKQLLQGFVHDEGAAFLGGISGNAGLFSDANDIAKLCQMWLNMGTYGGERYLSKETTRMFTSTKSPNSRRGLGFDKPDPTSRKASPTSPSTPASVYGHTGFTGTCFWVDPDNNMIYIFLSNRVNDTRTHKMLMTLNIRPRIQEEIYNAIR